ncbi:MAG TPA: hypothetical protein VE954_34235 [Oligoflexus sp.]|uniref:hypothetical protein n=1 Tax=Oligoflexus sp. TaxID=1971216 RepID=UPI002D375A19|nr:hypothetical protein [Oligoflexus sp.]HYX38188.1 hypothetical protein [Oligoflexus sp.]
MPALTAISQVTGPQSQRSFREGVIVLSPAATIVKMKIQGMLRRPKIWSSDGKPIAKGAEENAKTPIAMRINA